MGLLFDPRMRDAIGGRFHGRGTSGAPQLVEPSAAESVSFANDPGIDVGSVSVSPTSAISSSVALSPTLALSNTLIPASAISTSTSLTPTILRNITTTPVQEQAFSSSTGNTFGFTQTSTPIVNNVLIAAASAGATNQYITGISQTGVTWTQVVLSNTNRACSIWVGVVGSSPSASGTITINDLGSTTVLRTNISEWAGLNTVTTSDTSSGNSGSSTTPTTASITPTSGRNVLLIACMRDISGSFSSGPTNSFTSLSSPSNFYRFAYRVVSSASGSYSTSWTFTLTDTWETAIAAFRNPD